MCDCSLFPCSICNDLSSASIPTLGLVLPSIRSLIATCERQRVAAASMQPANEVAERILVQARDEYTTFFADWFSNDLLLAATLVDPTQATDYFLSGGGGVAGLTQAWAALENLAHNLTAPPPPIGGAAAAGGAAAGAGATSLAELFAAAAPGGAAAPIALHATLADERASFLAFMAENHAKLKDDKLSALEFYKKYTSRIPKISIV